MKQKNYPEAVFDHHNLQPLLPVHNELSLCDVKTSSTQILWWFAGCIAQRYAFID